MNFLMEGKVSRVVLEPTDASHLLVLPPRVGGVISETLFLLSVRRPELVPGHGRVMRIPWDH